ncbi:MAG: hypothetical protein NW207_01885 [Cytophagales bacterium]|nr:hypothetical protein [Cytophagales bacterium]
MNNKIYFLKYRISKILNYFIYKLLPYPYKEKGGQYSMIFPSRNRGAKVSKHLFDTALEAIKITPDIDLSDLHHRATIDNEYIDVFPGDHYRLLGAFMRVLKPKVVLEVGTFRGVSALAMRKYMPQEAVLHTFDIVEYHKYTGHYFKPGDFENGKLVQHISDISKTEYFAKYKELIESADFIFLDAAKDKVQERRFFEHFAQCKFQRRPIIMLDDIKVWNMLRIWEDIPYPKLDITSFGHFSGTGLVDICYDKYEDGLV